jgi:transcriptional regulator with XRE-family HTH domain
MMHSDVDRGRAREGKSGMSEERSDLIIEPKDFPVFLKARMMRDTVAEYAAKLGVTPKMLYMLLSGDRKPSAAILEKVGLEVVFRAVGDRGKR